jgi:hypothetical protein
MIKGRGDWGHALHSVSGTPTDAVGTIALPEKSPMIGVPQGRGLAGRL